MTEPAPATLAGALAAFQAQRPRVLPDAKNDHFASRYATLDQIEAAVLPMLGAQGLAWIAVPQVDDDGRMVLSCRLVHAASGEHIEARFPLSAGTVQALGSQLTYLRRYGLCAVVGVSADLDDDGNAASGPPPAAQPRQAPRPGSDAPRAARGQDAPATDAQLRKLGAVMREAGLTDRAQALDVVAQHAGRRVESRAELTKREVSRVIDALTPSSDDPWAVHPANQGGPDGPPPF